MKYATLTLLAVILLLTMFNNLEHIAQVYHAQVEGTSHSWLYEWIESYSVVITFDLLVIALIIAGKVTESVTVAWLIFALNLIFFDAIGKGYDVWYFFGSAKVFIASLNAFISTVIFSGLFAWSIHKLPILFKERIADNSTVEAFAILLKKSQDDLILSTQQCDDLGEVIQYHKKTIQGLLEQNKALEKQNTELKEDIQGIGNYQKSEHEKLSKFHKLFTCDCCQKFYVKPHEIGLESSVKALRAHMGVCKKQPKNIQS